MGCQPTGTRKRDPPGALPRLRESRPGVDPKVPWVSRATWLRHSAEMRDPFMQLMPLQWAMVRTHCTRMQGSQTHPCPPKVTTAFLRQAHTRKLLTVCPAASEALATMKPGAKLAPGAGGREEGEHEDKEEKASWGLLGVS